MKQRTKFLLLVGLFLLPTVASFIAFYFFPPGKSSNYGELVSPVIALPETPMTRVDKGPAVDNSLRGKWLMVTQDSGRCEDACRKKLYAMRQARLILGREQDRVLRVVLVDDDVNPSDALKAEFEGTIWISAGQMSWTGRLPTAAGANVRNHIYAVDTLGNLFMRYSSDPDIKKMSKDYLRVLKASQIG